MSRGAWFLMACALVFVSPVLLLSERPQDDGAHAAPGPTWPPSPAAARIRFVRSVTPAALQRRPSLLARTVNVIIGRTPPAPVMTQPYGVAVGPDARLYVADTQGGVVHVYDLDGRRYASLTVPDAVSLVGIAFAGPLMVVTDSVTGRVTALDPKGHVMWSRGAKDGFRRPTGLAAGPDRIFVVDTLRHAVVVLNVLGQVVGQFGSRGSEPGQFNFPTNIARRPDGSLLVTDAMNFRVQLFDAAFAVRGTFGQLGDGSGDFDKPKGIAVDSDGHIYVVEGFHDVVQIFNDEGRLLLSFGGSGAGPGQLWLPTGIAIVRDRIYVVDASNRRVQVFDYLKGA